MVDLCQPRAASLHCRHMRLTCMHEQLRVTGYCIMKGRARDPRTQPAEGGHGDGNGSCLHPVLPDAPVPLQPACSNNVLVHAHASQRKCTDSKRGRERSPQPEIQEYEDVNGKEAAAHVQPHPVQRSIVMWSVLVARTLAMTLTNACPPTSSTGSLEEAHVAGCAVHPRRRAQRVPPAPTVMPRPWPRSSASAWSSL